MAYKNKVIRNPVFGQEIVFLRTKKDTDGQFLEMRATYFPHSMKPAPHYHPYQEEHFEILEGEMKVVVGTDLLTLKQGERLHIPTNTVHTMWNDSEQKTKLIWRVEPALNTEYLLEMAAGLAMDGKINTAGKPQFLQSILMAKKFSNEFRMAKPPFWVQKSAFYVIAPLATLRGYKPELLQYID